MADFSKTKKELDKDYEARLSERENRLDMLTKRYLKEIKDYPNHYWKTPKFILIFLLNSLEEENIKSKLIPWPEFKKII